MKYSIPESNFEALSSKLKKIQNKCNKFGCEFTFIVLGEHMEDIFEDHHFVGAMKYIDVEVSGTAIINNWQFVATLEHTQAGNIVRVYDDQEVPKWAYTVEPKCDHCHTNHYRKDTYLVRNTITGEFKQVGRSCLKDFTNGLSAEHVADYMSYFTILENAGEFSGSGFKKYYDTKKYLLFVVETIKHFGYLSKSNAESYDDRPTSYRAFSYMMDPSDSEISEMTKAGFVADASENHKEVDEAMTWIISQTPEEGYLFNLKAACSKEYCESRDLGIIASLLPAHFRAIEKESERIAREAKKATQAESNWIGTEGDRIEITVDCKCVTCWQNEFGTTFVYKMTDDSGNIFTWKTGKSIDAGKVTLKGTIKAHTEFRGEKQTELTRCKLL